MVRDLKDLRGEWSSSMKSGNWFLFLMMIMLQRLKKTEICKRLRSVPWLLFQNANKSWSLIDEWFLMYQQSLSCDNHDKLCLLTRLYWLCMCCDSRQYCQKLSLCMTEKWVEIDAFGVKNHLRGKAGQMTTADFTLCIARKQCVRS